jgi:hypothetical protein
MAITLIVLSVLIALAVLALAGVAWAQARGRVSVALRVNALNIDATHKQAALSYFDGVAKIANVWIALRDHIIAPFVLLVPLLRLPRDADDLPDSLAYWRNNVSINGDGYGAQMPDGSWVDCSGGKPAPDGATLVLPYTDPRYGGDAYYAPGHHPRSFWARYVWLAFRNVAVKRMFDAGPLIAARPTTLAGNYDSVGWELMWNGGQGDGAVYQWHATEKWHGLTLWTNVGAKLGINRSSDDAFPQRSILTGTWRAVKF